MRAADAPARAAIPALSPGTFAPLRTAALQRLVALSLPGLVLLWTAAMSLFHATPPWDNVEELVWSASLEWGYYKHPPLPTWLLALPVRLLGREPWLTYAAGMVCAALALYFVWRWALEFTTPARAAASVLLGAAVAYHSVRAVIYNHNSVQLAPVAAYWWLLYRVLRPQDGGPRLRDGLGLGAAIGLAVLTKYNAVFQLAAGLGFVLYSGAWRRPGVPRQLALAGTVALLLVAPHLLWAWQHPDLSLDYARRAAHRVDDGRGTALQLLDVAAVQFARVLPMLGLWAWAAWIARASRAARPSAAPLVDDERALFAARYLAWACAAPLLLMFGLALATGWSLSSSWPTTFFVPAGLWLATRRNALAFERWSMRQWRLFAAGAAALQIVAALGQGIGGGWLADRVGRPARATFPSQQVAGELMRIWRQHTGRPLKVVVGETWLCGAVAIASGTDARVLIDGRPEYSPWLAPDAIERDGALVLELEDSSYASDDPQVDALLARSAQQGLLTLPWTSRPDGPQVRIRWGIVPPAVAR